MTLTPIQELKTGRMLDWYVAQVMGWAAYPKRVNTNSGEVLRVDIYAPGDRFLYGVFEGEGDFWDKVSADDLPLYSTDTDTALTLLPDYARFEKTPAGYWNVGFTPLGHPHGYGDTLADAICRAWLAWKNEQQ